METSNPKIIDISYEIGETQITANDLIERFDSKEKVIKNIRDVGIKNLYQWDKSNGDVVGRLVKQIHIMLEKHNLDLSDINAIYGSGNPVAKYIMPQMTAAVAAEAGFEKIPVKHAAIGCAGATVAIDCAFNHILKRKNLYGKKSYMLVIGGEDTSMTVNPQDPNTAIFFSDACYVMLLSNHPKDVGREIIFSETMSLLTDDIFSMTMANPLYESLSDKKLRDYQFIMNGKPVHRFGLELWDNILHLTQDLLLEDDLRKMYLIPHQANKRMIDLMARSYNLNHKLVYTDGIGNYGNTTNCSSVIGLADNFHMNNVIMNAPFGAELTIGVFITKPVA